MNAEKRFERFCRLFDAKISKQPNGCWNWTGAVRPGSHPYGKIGFIMNGIYIQLAHRFAFLRATGSLPDGLSVLHSCDNPRCVNPAHLFVGTQQDNVADCVSKGRIARPSGEKNPKAKLTAEKVLQIREQSLSWKKGDKTKVAREVGISRTALTALVSGKNWKHLPLCGGKKQLNSRQE